MSCVLLKNISETRRLNCLLGSISAIISSSTINTFVFFAELQSFKFSTSLFVNDQ